jgi:hypothetical protein
MQLVVFGCVLAVVVGVTGAAPMRRLPGFLDGYVKDALEQTWGTSSEMAGTVLQDSMGLLPGSFGTHSSIPATGLPPMIDAYARAQTWQAMSTDSMVRFLVNTLIPEPLRTNGPQLNPIMYPVEVNPVSFSSATSFNSPGPVFIADTFRFLYVTLNASVSAMGTSATSAAATLGGPTAAAGLQAAEIDLGPPTNETFGNSAVAQFIATMTCYDYAAEETVTLLRLAAFGVVAKAGPDSPAVYGAGLVVESDVVPGGAVAAIGACFLPQDSDPDPTNPGDPQCTQGVPVSPGVANASLAAFVSAIQNTTMGRCGGALMMCATSIGAGLSNVNQTHYSAVFPTQLQSCPFKDCPCVVF